MPLKKKKFSKSTQRPETSQVSGSRLAPISRSIHHRLVIAAGGLDGTGKTSFGLTAPGPIAYLSMNAGYEGVASKIPKNKEVDHAEFIMPEFETGGTSHSEGAIKREASREWSAFVKTHQDGMANYRTVVWDLNDEVWLMLRLARFGAITLQTRAAQLVYAPLNAEISGMMRRALFANTTTNLIILCGLDEIWEDQKFTGEYNLGGYKKTQYIVQASLRLYKDIDKPVSKYLKKKRVKASQEPQDTKFWGIIDKCRHNTEVEGTRVEGEDLNFANVAGIITGTKEEEWAS